MSNEPDIFDLFFGNKVSNTVRQNFQSQGLSIRCAILIAIAEDVDIPEFFEFGVKAKIFEGVEVAEESVDEKDVCGLVLINKGVFEL